LSAAQGVSSQLRSRKILFPARHARTPPQPTCAAGILDAQVWLDPRFGFGKTPPQNLECLRRLERMHDMAAIRPAVRMTDAIRVGLRWHPPG
jgi:hypothetical protein